MGEIMDANEMLSLTCQRLKEEAGRPQDFSYDDLAGIKQAQAGEVCATSPLVPHPPTNANASNHHPT